MKDIDPLVREVSIRIIANICTGTQECVEEVIINGGLEALQQLITNEKYTMHQKEICWTYSNIAAGPNEHVKRLIDSGVIEFIAKLAMNSNEFSISKEACWTIANSCSDANEYQIKKLIEFGVIPVLLKSLTIQDPLLQDIVIDSIDHLLAIGYTLDVDNQIADIFEENGGVKILDNLLMSNNTMLSSKVAKILKTYFELYYQAIEARYMENPMNSCENMESEDIVENNK